ncbi:pseudouridine synthase [Burkholderia dolosa]|uniref:pseudouridine synthase n=1 Tax=Burkholderia dolosa TaxID=152500 RepID=UPI001B9D9790|nr:pseudouridine synthase [Burkholderia dolosa]MBR8457549.1 pseudouridine synthase [Burkholderia dolosa]MDN7421961.1 pseudouridine synthase [Burkholderia dolosa]
MRTKLTVKNPRPASPTRAPVRSGSLVARKAVRPAAPPPAAAKPARPKKASAPPAGGKRPSTPGSATAAERPNANRTAEKRPARDGGAARGYRGSDAKPAGRSERGDARPYRSAGGKPDARPARRSDDDARPRRAATGSERDGAKRAPYRDKADAEGAKRSFGDRRTSSDRPPRRNDDDARPRRGAAGSERDGAKRAPYRDKAAAEGTKRSFGDRRTSSDRPARRAADDARPRRTSAAAESAKRAPYRDTTSAERTKRSAGERRSPGTALKAAQPVKRRATDVDRGDESGLMRLSKRMSELGLCSRREADEWIEKGWVLVDGERIDTLGTKVRADQRIEIDERAQAAQAAQVTILLHKPVGYVSGQAEDGYEPATVLITRENHWSGDRSPLRFSPQHLRTLAPAGRLDIDSTGLLVLTQNGRIAKQLIGEQSDVDKEYLVRVRYGDMLTDIDRHFPAESLAKLRHGLELDGVALKPAMVSWQNGEQLRFVLREGRKRQIRRMCELVGLDVIGLKRVRMGRVMLGALPQGQWRYLSADETF